MQIAGTQPDITFPFLLLLKPVWHCPVLLALADIELSDNPNVYQPRLVSSKSSQSEAPFVKDIKKNV